MLQTAKGRASDDPDSPRRRRRSNAHLPGARAGTEALPLLKASRFDLLLSDIVMPEMDGIELAQHCAEISPETKVIFITGFAAVTLKTNAETAQARVLSKPFHLKDLVLEVQRVFGQQNQMSI